MSDAPGLRSVFTLLPPELPRAWRAATPGLAARRRWIVANAAFAAFVAIVVVGVSPFQQVTMGSQGVQGDLVDQGLHLTVLMALLFSRGPVPSRALLMAVPPAIVLLLGYCLVTIGWAIAPMIALRRLVLAASVIWVVFRCVGDLGYGRTLRIVEYALIGLLVANYLAVFLTDFGIHTPVVGEESTVVGNWRGVLPHKNTAGATCAFTILLLLFDTGRVPRLVAAAAVAGAAVFLYYTQSRTSEVMLVVALLGGSVIWPYSANYRALSMGLGILVAGVAFEIASAFTGPLNTLLDDPAALTGRATIWPLLIDYARDHPLTGAGFGSFWQIGDASPIWTLTSGWVAQYASHGHNGYLDLLVTIGWPGLIATVFVMMLWPLGQLLLSPAITKPQRSLLLALLIFCAGHNLSESSLMIGSAVVQVFLVIAIALIHYLARAPQQEGAVAR